MQVYLLNLIKAGNRTGMKRIFLYTLILLVIVSCGTSHKSNRKPPAITFKKETSTIHPKFVVFNSNDTISELHFKIASKELLYTRPDGINFSSNVIISYRLLSSYDSKEILDTASVRLVDENNNSANKYLVGKIDVRAKAHRNYILRITVTDLNKNTSVSTVTTIEKDNDLNRQNFMVKLKSSDAPLFCNYSKTGEELVIKYKAKIAVNVYVNYYNRNFPLAAPPFATGDPEPFKYKSDSTFVLQLSSDGSLNFTAAKKGFYHFQLDTSKRDGLTLFNFSDYFPEVKKTEDMIPPLRFITTKQEYDEMSLSANKKVSMEKFWVNCSGNQDRAREVIKKFYSRMQDANNYFTSYLEGWKTDRGMIFLIYGAPNTIYRTANTEIWTYGEDNNINSLQYSFTKVANPFTDNDYVLERSAVYKQSWYNSVDIWRQGKIYLQD